MRIGGFFQLDKDQKPLRRSWEMCVRRASISRLSRTKSDYMIDNDYYENIYESILEPHEVDRHLSELTHGYQFEFASYMAASKFYTDYA